MQISSLKSKPIVSIIILIIVTLFWLPNPACGASIVNTDKDIYNYGEMIKVIFSNSPGNDGDWICIVPVGSPETEGGNYKYIPRGLGQGFLIFDPPSPGEYEVRAYYNYRRNGYVVSGRYAFSVVSDPVNERALAQDMEPMEPDNSVEANLPPPISFAVPPEVVVIPETNVYVAPDIAVDLFFWDGWWWRPWEGHWYRSHYYDRGWGYYNNVPSFYFDVDPRWRGYYRDRNWYGHRWNYERIPNQRLQQKWKSWQNDRHWERQGTWGVQNYKPRPQQQRQELRQQRQQQYQQRTEVQKQRPPQEKVQQPQRRPQVQQPPRQPEVPQPQRPPQDRQPPRPSQEKVQQTQRRPQVQQPPRQPEVPQPQRPPQDRQPPRPSQEKVQQTQKQPEVQQPPRQSQRKPEKREEEKQDRK
jgi:hypothetical protein